MPMTKKPLRHCPVCGKECPSSRARYDTARCRWQAFYWRKSQSPAWMAKQAAKHRRHRAERKQRHAMLTEAMQRTRQVPYK
jgi:hypothetical protein